MEVDRDMDRERAEDPVSDLPNCNTGRYLREILIAVDGPRDEVRPSEIADRLDVTPASVTGMTGRLAADGYVDHEPYGGIRLTTRGAKMARHVQWRQCVLQQFFSTYLDVEIPESASYPASFALPVEAIRRLREVVDIDCRDECDDRVWGEECECRDPLESTSLSTPGIDDSSA